LNRRTKNILEVVVVYVLLICVEQAEEQVEQLTAEPDAEANY
jgi:hypothetical protein